MADIVEENFKEWTKHRSAKEARISVYEKIRDIPYAIIPELIHPENYINILRSNRGSCTPKHFLLCNMYQSLEIPVLYAVYPFRWDELEVDYPSNLKRLAKALPVNYHLACKVDIEGKLVLVDATVDLPLEKLGLPANKEWDGVSHTLLPIKPLDEQIYHPFEGKLISPSFDEKSLAFYKELNSWLDEVRNCVDAFNRFCMGNIYSRGQE